MKQVLIISGKGGTGKTILTGAFGALANNAILVDCDVDAADMHLLLSPLVREKNDFKSGKTAFINKDKCVQCGLCGSLCRFDAITEDFTVNAIACEGCSFCAHACPCQAIEMRLNESGEWYVSDTRFGPLVHARLGIAEENSGKLVSCVKEHAVKLALKDKRDLVIIDGPPGIGCPVIASLSGVDMALVVVEPSMSGLHDAKRVIDVARHFQVPVKLVINKFTLNDGITEQIEEHCIQNDIPLIGKIPFDKTIVESMVQAKTVIEYPSGKSKEIIMDIWEKLLCELT